MKTKIIIITTLLSSLPCIHADRPYGNNNNNINREKVYDHIQNFTSQHCGKQFSLIPEKDRQGIYQEAQTILFPYGNVSLVEKEDIRRAVTEALTHYAGKLMEKVASEERTTPLTVKQVRELYEQKIRDECRNNPHNNYFQNYLDQNVVYKTMQQFNKNALTHQYEQENAGLYGWVQWLFSSPSQPSVYEPTYHPEPSAPTYDQVYGTQYSHPEPSAPTYEQVYGNTTQTKPHPETMCMICYNDFGQNIESFFLPCGHNLCKACIKRYVFQDSHSECPSQCSEKITSEFKTNIQAIFNNGIKNVCAYCHKKDNLSLALACGHYMCATCKNSWINQADKTFAHECPRCYKQAL